MEENKVKIEWGNERRKLNELIEFKKNPRKLTKKQYEDLRKSLDKFGLAEIPAINQDNTILAGHQRIKVLGLIHGPEYEIDVRIPNQLLDEETAKEYLIRSNKNTGEWDFDILANEFDMEDLLDWGFTDDDFFGKDIFEPEETEGNDEVPEVPEEPITVKGDLYELGEHKILCGDSTVITDIEKLMAGQKADMVFTDPPYGIDYEGKTKDKLKIKSDNLGKEELIQKINEWFNSIDYVLKDGGYILLTVAPDKNNLFFEENLNKRGWLRQIMVWNKDSMVLGHSEYNYKHESILFGWKPGQRLKNNDRTKTTVWDFSRPKASREHPTMKPVEMWMYGICNHSKQIDIIFEPFFGSGTTLIACEKTNRKCYGLELDPKYCDVIVKRYIDFCKKNNRPYSVKRNGEVCNDFEK